MRTVLHSDLNAFYATAEQTREPSLADVPFAVTGDAEERHGIILAKNALAKSYGVATGDVIWQARKKCPALAVRKADFGFYLHLSKKVRAVYERFTDRVEAFGIDECWLDVTDSRGLFGDGETIAEKIRLAVREELGLTVSVGVSYNKIFAKFASDLAPPDAVFSVTPDNCAQTVWCRPAEELLYVGKATKEKLNRLGIFTVGDVARADPDFLRSKLGKWGLYLSAFSRGEDQTPVRRVYEEENVKSIGNSMTLPRDAEKTEDVRAVLFLLAESVAARLAESDFLKARTVTVTARSASLVCYRKQGLLPAPSRTAETIGEFAYALFSEVYPFTEGVRSLGVQISGFTGRAEQLSFDFGEKEKKREDFERAVGEIRRKYGADVLTRAVIFKNCKLRFTDVKRDHVIHPENFFGKDGKS